MYAFLGDIRSEVVDESKDKACFRASLSVQDLERVGGASGREGLRRRCPRWEKLERPRRADGSGEMEDGPEERGRLDVGVDEGDDTVAGGEVQGVASTWEDMTSSMLASPQGASEQYMWMWTSGGMVKG